LSVFRNIFKRALNMCDLSYSIMKYALLFSCLMLAGSLSLFLFAGGFSVFTYGTYYCAEELLRLPFIVLLIGIIASVCVEDLTVQ
jgi:hypothetical protein